jgi:hypothetical protein
VIKSLALCFTDILAGFAIPASAREKQTLGWCKRFRCRESKAASITWASIWKRSVPF